MRIHELFCAASLLVGTLFFSGASRANPNYFEYKTNYPPVGNNGEINGSLGAGTARSFVASGLMGAKFFGNANVAGQEGALLNACKSITPANSTWPERCSFGQFQTVLNDTFGQNWFAKSYSPSQQSIAINAQLNALRIYQSPSLVPIYGQADHWATVYEMRVDLNMGEALVYVKFYDGGPEVLPGTPAGEQESDGGWNYYEDGVGQASGATWKTTFYKVLTSVGTSDPYYNKYLVAYDPPSKSPQLLAMDTERIQSMSTTLVPFPGIVAATERMDAGLAEARVWDAIFLAGIDDDPLFWSALEKGTAGEAREIHGYKPSGEVWDYFLVPILINDGEVSAMVQLAKSDGALEQIWIPSKPLPFLGISRQEAFARAAEMLLPDETLAGGELTWDPALNDAHCRSPLLPYYQFDIHGKEGELRGGVIVALDDGVARGVKALTPQREISAGW
ncbi:hypothetical protein [Chondromyces apiculatus]|uniref:Uncharacterized protein n=1 Tax=Chondromyces apiculatus DSM 436 TaxID=1192034 RepID=A0A017SYU9_9BACT|nr:hypothetical protein [Chondromyces apiculatus]EYF01795.1 Hypothetical protein CAP_7748 [Chondromyces apiculatus DSM 436]